MTSRPIRPPALLALALTGVLALTGAPAAAAPAVSAPAAKPAAPDPAPPEWSDVEVHDPSLVSVGDEHYLFGSHLAAAKTEDFVSFEQVANHVTPENPLFDDVRTELAETFKWAETETLWAPDVIQLEHDGRYYMYYDACRGDSPRSALGVAVADDVDGPYTDLGIILKSGHRDGEGPSEDGTPYDALVHPNAVDPDVFYDADGRLWMVYGSFSGGMFILELDPTTGLPFPDQGYGTHLTGGNHSRIEGPSMMYDPETEHYYLFTSFGGLDADAGYNMRVMRSTNPDGPFVDAEGNDMREVRSDPDLPVFDDVTIEPFGVKLMGNYLFPREVGAPGEGIGAGKVSPGHNTTYTDPETGEQLLIFHSRFPDRGEFHQVRVHEMTMNADGWPIVSPHRYAGGHEKSRFFRSDIPGDYQVIVHDKTISPDIRTAETVTLSRNGRISGAHDGRWRAGSGDRLTLTIDGSTYRGVISREWDPTSERWVDAFSAVSEAGVAVWGTPLPAMTDAEVVDAVLSDLEVPGSAIADLDLPTTGTHGSEISWTSSAPEVVDADGSVTRDVENDASATLTATITKGDARRQASFTVAVPAQPAPGLVARYRFDGDLAADDDRAEAGRPTGDRIGALGGEVAFDTGVHGSAVALDGTSGVRLPDGLIDGTSYSVALWLRPDALTPFSTTFFGARNDTNWVSLVPEIGFGEGHTMLWAGSTAPYDGDAGATIPADEWTHVAFTVDDDDVTLLLDGEVAHSGAGFPDVFTTADSVFALGVNWWDAPYEGAIDDLQVYRGTLTPAQVAEIADGEVADL
ncbi:family 43 glycosylhydrolase [Microbacterium sp. G2-8]|uniref:family 43 glycosylhydrolase n=1 Tax=Microbacterium sp. G2-8 TaxID=2842454 RepID=UPI001C8A17D3|nr:family 43 glycosylhydrolase [Microbacterium sp. G2-8]